MRISLYLRRRYRAADCRSIGHALPPRHGFQSSAIVRYCASRPGILISAILAAADSSDSIADEPAVARVALVVDDSPADCRMAAHVIERVTDLPAAIAGTGNGPPTTRHGQG